jgi:outer membrane receptor for ferrienterochelin and colicins
VPPSGHEGQGVTGMRVQSAALLGAAFLAFAGLAHPSKGLAQDLPGPAANTVVYDQTFFAGYSVNNAEDMLRLIPGVPAILDDRADQQERGFGSGGARVLINGRRFPGKANEITTNLRRISPQNVERVELIRGVSETVAVQSEGVLVNLVLREGANLAATGSWELNYRFTDQADDGVDGLFSYSGNWRQLSYNLGIERNLWAPPGGDQRWTWRFHDELYLYPTGELLEARPQSWQRDHEKWIYTGGLTYDFLNQDRLQFNAFYQTLAISEKEITPFTRYDTAGNVILKATDARFRDQDFATILELSGQYEAEFGPGGLNALYLFRRQTRPTLDFRNRFAAGSKTQLSRSINNLDTGEDILRASYTLPIFTGQTLEFGGEGARNTLDQQFRVFFDTDSNGTLEEVPIPTAIAHVQELRGEAFANHKWAVSEALSLDSSLNFEFSKLTNTYPFSPERKLSFLKPRLDARYRVTDADQLRLLVERTISQLDFGNFVPNYNVVDQRINAGNPNLEPEKTWIYELGYEHQLAGDMGVLEGRAFYHAITDYIDKIPYFDQGILVSAQGNIPEATVYGFEAKASVRLGWIDLRDATLSGRYLHEWSDVADPFTGESRRVLDDRGGYSYDLGFRHDVRPWGMSYGVDYQVRGGEQFISDLTVREFYTIHPRWTAFVERRIFGNMTLRFEGTNIFGAHEFRRRILYVTDVMNGAVRRTEQWRETRDVRFAIRLRGRF